MFEQPESPSIPNSPRWRPVWLRKSTLSGFVVLFLSMFVAVFLVWYFATKKQGLTFTITKNHYAWTYGPTAILVVVVALWKRVNYCVMINQPWIELHNGPSPAEKTILLDYIWPLLPNSFVNAIRNRHLAVVTTILIFVLLKIIIIISTSLFMPQDTPRSQQIPITRQTKFDASHFWEAHDTGDFSSVSVQPIWDYKFLLKQYSPTDIPSNLYYASTNFSTSAKVPHDPGRRLLASAKVEVFQPHISCDVADLSWPETTHGTEVLVNLTTPSCNIGTVPLQICSPSGLCDGSQTEALVFSARYVDCVDGTAISKSSLDGFHPSYSISPQQVIFAGKVSLSNEIQHDTTGLENPLLLYSSYDIEIQQIAAVSCSLDYSIQHGIAHGMVPAISQLDSSTIVTGDNEIIANLSTPLLHEIALRGMALVWGDTFKSNDVDKLVIEDDTFDGYQPALLTLFLQVLSPNDLLDAQTLQVAAENILSGLSQQIMRQLFLVPDERFHSQGIVEYMESRLRVRPAIIWVIGGLLSSCAILVFIIIYYTPHGVAPQQAGHIIAGARVLFKSPTVLELLRNPAASTRTSDIRAMLAGYNFTAVEDGLGTPQIKTIPKPRDMDDLPVRGGISSESGEQAASKPKRAWMPYSARKHAMALTLLLPGVSMIVLQVLWHYSTADKDFVAASEDDFTIYVIRYGSTGTALLIATLFNSLDFSIATMTPFSSLAQGAKGKRTALFNMIEDLPPVALYKTVRYRNIGATFSVLASTIGSLLTIITSGLWVQTDVAVRLDATAVVQSGWNISFPDYGHDWLGRSGSFSDRYFEELQRGFTGDTSPLVWDDSIVFSTMSNHKLIDPHRIPRGVANGQFHVVTPAIQPYLECSIFPTHDAIMTDGRVMASTNISSPAECVDKSQPSGYAPSLPTENWTEHFNGSDFSNSWYSWERSIWPLRNLTTAQGCPSFAAMFRRWNESPLEADATLYAVGCTQRLQRVDVNVIYPISLSSSTPPPSLSRPENVTMLPKPPVNLVESSSGLSYLMFDIPTVFGINHFIESAIESSGGTPAEDITSPESLIEAMNRLYRKLMVHVLDRNFRTYDLSNTTLPVPGEGIVDGTYNVTFTRVKINQASKIILQSMLGAMMLLGGLSYWLVDMRVLPRNPYPIASRMAFFCQSERLREYLDSSSRVDDVAEKMFRLGWWDSTDEATRNSSGISITETFGIDIMHEDEQSSKLLQ